MPNAFSYHANRSERQGAGQGRVPTINMERTGKERSVSAYKRLVVLALFVFALIFAVFTSWVSSSPEIKIIQPTGFSYAVHSASQYQQAASKALGASLYNHFKMTLNSTQVNNSIEQTYPEIEYASVTVPFVGATPTVYIQLQRPALIYGTSTNSYIVDSDGVIIAGSSALSPKELAGLYTVNNSANNQLNLGQQVLTQQNVTFIETVAQALKTKNVAVSKMDLTPAAAELDVYIQGQPYYVKFNIYQTDALQQVGTYLATLATLKQQGKTASQYIDVRVDGRAYYK